MSLLSKNMTLSFPNHSRSFDGTKNRVRFWGYDTAIEISFFVESAALRMLVPDMSDGEADTLKAFDVARKQIHEAANNVYAHRGRKGSYSYILGPGDF